MLTIEELYTANRENPDKFSTNDEFMHYAVELYKEFYILLSGVTHIEGIYQENFSTKDAIIFGLLRKYEDLGLNQTNLICNGSIDSLQILNRTSMETLVTILLFQKNYNDEKIFTDYIKYSLFTEKRYYEFLISEDDNPDAQNERQKKMRERMKSSIVSAFESASVDIETFNIYEEKKTNFWYKTKIRQRFNLVGLEGMYSVYTVNCHSSHGNWQNLKSDFLHYTSEGISVAEGKRRPIPQLVLPYILIGQTLLDAFIQHYIQDQDIKNIVSKRLDDCCDEAYRTNIAHERYLVTQRDNHTY